MLVTEETGSGVYGNFLFYPHKFSVYLKLSWKNLSLFKILKYSKSIQILKFDWFSLKVNENQLKCNTDLNN